MSASTSESGIAMISSGSIIVASMISITNAMPLNFLRASE